MIFYFEYYFSQFATLSGWQKRQHGAPKRITPSSHYFSRSSGEGARLPFCRVDMKKKIGNY